ncbi:DUF4468 domain-containing protein [Ravibacter arvi]|uniref:DUF4468 domain-containing protein n=1 Tax=Ravibacter arvi TaxID=2051041 RepID=A0ABP8M018_9BACT
MISLGNYAFGQKDAPVLPIDKSTKKITYSEVVYVADSADKYELFTRAKEWFSRAYKPSTSIIQMEDKEGGAIVGKALMQVYHKALGTHESGYINYTISIYFKDGRYRFEITDFHHTGQYVQAGRIQDFGPCERMINSTEKIMGISAKKTFNYYLYQMDNEIKSRINDLKLSMKISSKKNKSSEW